jgi:hypothetical protein
VCVHEQIADVIAMGGSSVWLYDKPICTGLGDRLGLIISLSALASLNNNSTVYMEWCTVPERAVLTNPVFMRWVPKWTGFNYPLDKLQQNITLPSNVVLFVTGELPRNVNPGQVISPGILPAWQAIPMNSILYCRSLTITSASWTDKECLQAYRQAGGQVKPLMDEKEKDIPFILVHFRAHDDNTAMVPYNTSAFCTKDVLRELHALGGYMKVVSNNHRLSMKWMRGLPSMNVVHTQSPYMDMKLALSAAAIVQHAPHGWSSFTSVPAMAKEIPLINTFTGADHRFNLFSEHNGLPPEFYSCQRMKDFIEVALHSYKTRF